MVKTVGVKTEWGGVKNGEDSGGGGVKTVRGGVKNGEDSGGKDSVGWGEEW